MIEVQPQGGTGLLRDEAQRRLVAELQSPTREPVTLPVGEVQPRITSEEVARAAAQARALLAAPVELVTGTKTLTILPIQIATALDTRIDDRALTLTLEPEELRAALGEALADLETPPVDAGFEVTSANTVQVVPSQNGRQVDMNAVAAAILAGQRRIDAPIAEVVPERDTAWAEGLGIKEEVSTFTTRHASGEARVTNIHIAADLLNNTIVEPGATFSLNDTIGPRTVDRGFVLAPVFYGEFTEDIGGGVSQLATTTFNAVFWGGYEDVFHKPHTIYITRYPMGREATVNYGTVDLQFRNDSNAGVLIRTCVLVERDLGDVLRRQGRQGRHRRRPASPRRAAGGTTAVRVPGPDRTRQEQRLRDAAGGPAEAGRGRPRGDRRGVLPGHHPTRTGAGTRALLLALPHDTQQVPRGYGPGHNDHPGAASGRDHGSGAGRDHRPASGRTARSRHRGCPRALDILELPIPSRARRGADCTPESLLSSAPRRQTDRFRSRSTSASAV